MSPQWKPSRNAPASSRKGQKLAEPAAPVIRWQDLGELPKYEVIIKAPEEKKNLPRGKGKAQIGNKAEGPPLANYIKASEYSKACKMCCNTDYHATFQCPNLTPELKERLKEVRSKCAKFKPYHPDDLTCHICLKKGDHWSSECSYTNHYPAGAIVGPFAAIVCKCCGKEDAHLGKPGIDWGTIAVRKFCYACGCPSDHWDKGCPKAAAMQASYKCIKGRRSCWFLHEGKCIKGLRCWHWHQGKFIKGCSCCHCHLHLKIRIVRSTSLSEEDSQEPDLLELM